MAALQKQSVRGQRRAVLSASAASPAIWWAPWTSGTTPRRPKSATASSTCEVYRDADACGNRGRTASWTAPGIRFTVFLPGLSPPLSRDVRTTSTWPFEGGQPLRAGGACLRFAKKGPPGARGSLFPGESPSAQAGELCWTSCPAAQAPRATRWPAYTGYTFEELMETGTPEPRKSCWAAWTFWWTAAFEQDQLQPGPALSGQPQPADPESAGQPGKGSGRVGDQPPLGGGRGRAPGLKTEQAPRVLTRGACFMPPEGENWAGGWVPAPGIPHIG